jgi:signal transduction histidine kinase
MRASGQVAEVVRSVAGVRRTFAVGLGAIAFLWLVVVPAFEVWQRYGEARLEAQIRLGLVADRISTFVAAHLDVWEYEEVRLPSLVADVLRGAATQPSRLAFIDDTGSVNEFPVRGRAGRFNLTVEDTVTDGRRPVGRVVMEVPLDTALRPGLLFAVVGMGSVGVLLLLIRLVGRRALDRSLAVIEDTSASLAARVAELEEARRQLAAHSLHLRKATEDITHAALVTTHHLREPLRTILSYSQLLIRWHQAGAPAEAADDAESYVGFLKTGVVRMQTQLKVLSSYLALRERPLEPVRLEPGDVLAVAVRRLDGLVRVECGELPALISDPEMLADLFADLLAFTVRYLPPGAPPLVRVTAVPAGGDWEIRLTDDGPPLAERDPDRMFHLLVHAEGGATSPGLAQARLIAFLLGGDLSAGEGEGGRGAVLRLVLPAGGPAPSSAGIA